MTFLIFNFLRWFLDPLYGFDSTRRGGSQVPAPAGWWSWPMSEYTNCVCFVTVLLFLLQDALGHGIKASRRLWDLGMLTAGANTPGCAELAVKLGLSDDYLDLRPGDRLEAQTWYVAQGWVDSDGDGDVDEDDRGGHALLLYVLPNGRIVTLEARGRNKGGARDGQDGVGSRCCTPRNARDWEPNSWGDFTSSFSEANLLKTWPLLFVAKLNEAPS
jgi:hypothetical protein